MSTCRSCGAEVVFVPSAKTGKPMILDAKSEKRIVLVPADTHRLEDHYSGKLGAYGPEVAVVVDTYVDHHATCPQAAEWKGRRRAG